MDLEDELRSALRVDLLPLDGPRLLRGVDRRRSRRRALRGCGVVLLIGMAAFALVRPRHGRPTPMFAIGIASAEGTPQADDARLMHHALERYERGDGAGTAVLLQKVIDDHPRSRYLAEAAIGRGDALFEAGRLTEALAYYEIAAGHPESRVYRYALYKTGWVHYNEGDPERAKQAWKRVLDGGDAKDAVVREAAKDLEKLGL
jgi:tetratricopeptide (TPR) repeat protein